MHTFSSPYQKKKEKENRQERKCKKRKKQGCFYSHCVHIFLCIVGIGIYGP